MLSSHSFRNRLKNAIYISCILSYLRITLCTITSIWIILWISFRQFWRTLCNMRKLAIFCYLKIMYNIELSWCLFSIISFLFNFYTLTFLNFEFFSLLYFEPCLSLHCFHFGLHFSNNPILYFVNWYHILLTLSTCNYIYCSVQMRAYTLYYGNVCSEFSTAILWEIFFGQYFSSTFPSFILENLGINFVLILFWWITHYYFSWFRNS